MDVEEESEEPQSPEAINLHAHRLDHNPSKLPAFRFVDLNRVPLAASTLLSPDLERANATNEELPSSLGDEVLSTTASTPLSPYSPTKRPSTSPGGGTSFPLTPSQTAPVFASRLQDKRSRRAPASHSSNGIETATGPPPALSTQRSIAGDPPRIPNTSTTEWALAQQQLAFRTLNSPAEPVHHDVKPTNIARNLRGASKSLDESTSSTRPLIPPIRSFRSSATRASLEMNGKSIPRFEAQLDEDSDRDRTLRALEGYAENGTAQGSHATDQNEQGESESATEDLFLNLARDDQDNGNNGMRDSSNFPERRRSRISQASNRQSLPLVPGSYQQSAGQSMPRRGSDLQGSSTIASREDNIGNRQADHMSYQSPIRDRPVLSSALPVVDLNRSRHAPSVRSFPTTPRTESQLSNGRRRSDSNGSATSRPHSYRQSNINYSAPRVYNSSPLVARSKEVEDGPETPRLAEGTESTASTTAPSTVWDELDDLKSRIRKLELTGKLPATSGAAVSHASGERPPTATTTITTMSTSPKRGRGLSTSPIESNGAGIPIAETHPLLHSALAKSKPLLNSEVYKALESTASDALAIASLVGSVGQPGTISSAPSTIGIGPSTATDRQLRRKADSLCRSLTELCLALSEVRPEQAQQQSSQALTIRPASRDRDFQNDVPDSTQRSTDTLAPMKSSPRALSRFEVRRSSLLATSSLQSPRYAHSDVPTPTQSLAVGRRTSLLLRNRRGGTEEGEEEEQIRFRAPSRAATEITRTRNPPREYTSQQPLPEVRAPSVQSSLPLRRQYVSPAPNVNVSQHQTTRNSMVNGRRFLERSTPERDTGTSSVITKLAEDRGQRGPGTAAGLSFEGRGLGRTGSLSKDRRLRPQLRERAERGDSEVSTQAQAGAYQ